MDDLNNATAVLTYDTAVGPLPQMVYGAMGETPQSPPKEVHLHTNDESLSLEDGTDEEMKRQLLMQQLQQHQHQQNAVMYGVTSTGLEGDSGLEDGIDGKNQKELTELEKYWKVVRDNPQDFTGWTYLLQYVEQENDLEAAREAFDAFFCRYPYCYGYWKKYADMEKKHDNTAKCEEVFERGLKAIPLSVDLWLHYLNFYKVQHKDDLDAEDKIRKVFERSIGSAGTEFRSDKLWEMYIAWEQESKRLKNITALYDRLLAIPTQLYSHHYERFEEHINKNIPKDVLSTDEFLSLRKSIIAAQSVGEEVVASEVDRDSPPPGLEEAAPPGESHAVDPVSAKPDDEETFALRKKILELREAIHKANEEEVGRRWTFEEGIKRPYFHVKPLERSQLKNWCDYLDFEIENGSHERVVILFERCMIACALYEDLWTKYAKYMEGFSEEGARNVYQRACTIHLPRKPSIHISWATFEEKRGNLVAAREILTNLEVEFPGYLPVSFRKINLERRQGSESQVEELFRAYMRSAKTQQIASTFAIKLARYYLKVQGDMVGAVKVLNEALQNDKENPKIYMQLIDICYQSAPINEADAIKVFDLAIQSEIAPDQKVLFAQRKTEFLEDFGASIIRLQEAYEDLNKLQKLYGIEKKKRSSPDDGKSDDGQKDKKAKIEVNGSATATAMAAAAMAATVPPPPVQTTADQTAYNYHTGWAGYPQGYGYSHQAWNPYGQHYYTQ